ncbi:unnamed protein product [Amoebophrya sp. A25]|nr:unnamed protein product [Amoebophrya sp. A25]|eukprot:GSA25T00016565001.1
MEETFVQPILGIDIGSSSCKVAFISEKGTTVEIVQNEVNSRVTPTVVGFTRKQRLEGDGAQSLIKSNMKNSVRNFKHLLGRQRDDAALKDEEFWSLCPFRYTEGGSSSSSGPQSLGSKYKTVGFEVSYLGEKTSYTAMQIVGMLLVKIRKIAIKWCNFYAGAENAGDSNGLTDDKKLNVVISCPAYYDDFCRRSLLDAASLAGMQVLRIITDGAAVAVSYGPYRVEELTKEQTHVAFCQCGHSASSVAIARFTKDGLQLVSETCGKFGARDFDLVIMKYFAAEFKEKNKLDPLENKKSVLKLEEAVQKTKKILSSNDEAPVNVECLLEDYDISSKISREKFEELCEPYKQQLRTLIADCLTRACLDASQIDTVEIIGGTSRVQWVQRICEECFQKPTLGRTLNADEAVVRGCALQAAIYSPLYRVRDYNVWLYSQRGVSVTWDDDDGPRTQEVFPAQSPLNLVKVLALYRPTTFNVTAFYSDEPQAVIASYRVEVDNPSRAKVQLKVKLDVHGLFGVDGCRLVDESNADKGGKALKFATIGAPGCTPEELQALQRMELQFQEQGAIVQRLENLRNDVETEVYRQRSAVQTSAQFAKLSAGDKSTHLDLLQSTEDWIYDMQDELTEDSLNEKVAIVKEKYALLEQKVK